MKPIKANAKRAERHETDIVRHVKFTKSNAPPCEKLLQRLRARVKNAGRESEESKQRSAPSGGDDVEARRLNKKRENDEACMRFDAVTADTNSEEKVVE